MSEIANLQEYPPQVTPTAYNALVRTVKNIVAGFTPTGTFISPYNYVISTDGIYFYATSASQIIYGGPNNAGNVDGTDADAVINAALTLSGLSFLSDATYPINAKIIPHNHSGLVGESFNAVLNWVGPASSMMFGNTNTAPLVGFTLGNLKIKANHDAVANVSPIVLYSPQLCRFENLMITDCDDKPAISVYAVNMGGLGVLNYDNAMFNVFRNIYMQNCGNALLLEGWDNGEQYVPVTANHFSDITAMQIKGGKGIRFIKDVDTNIFSNIGLELTAAGDTGIIWNDSATPDANMAVYNNDFDFLWVNAFEDANDASTTLLKFNCTKGNKVEKFIMSPAENTFLGTVVNAAASAISYYVENLLDQDVSPRIYTKEYNYHTVISEEVDVRDIHTSAFFSVGGYGTNDNHIYLKTKVGGATKILDLVMTTATGTAYMGIPVDLIHILPDNVGVHKISILDSDYSEVHKVDSDGNVVQQGTMQPVGGYKAGDGTVGETFSATSIATLTVKNGLVVAHT